MTRLNQHDQHLMSEPRHPVVMSGHGIDQEIPTFGNQIDAPTRVVSGSASIPSVRRTNDRAYIRSVAAPLKFCKRLTFILPESVSAFGSNDQLHVSSSTHGDVNCFAQKIRSSLPVHGRRA
jgi:hypothetical protein